MKQKNIYIIDFDSTFTQVEALDELARISLKKHPEKDAIFQKIEDYTNLAMEGKLSFGESLAQRVKLLEANEDHLKQLITHLKKKVSASFSWQLTPAWVHQNLVPTAKDKNHVFALGIGGRVKLTKRFSINSEYNWLPDGQVESENVYNSFSLGADLETGGHVFQLIFTNSAGMTAPYYLTKNGGSWSNGDIYFGFNITRIFHFKK